MELLRRSWEKYQVEIVGVFIASGGLGLAAASLPRIWRDTPKEIFGLLLVSALGYILHARGLLKRSQALQRRIERTCSRQTLRLQGLKARIEELTLLRAKDQETQRAASCAAQKTFRAPAFSAYGASWIPHIVVIGPNVQTNAVGPLCLECGTAVFVYDMSKRWFPCSKESCKNTTKFPEYISHIQVKVKAMVRRMWETDRDSFKPYSPV